MKRPQRTAAKVQVFQREIDDGFVLLRKPLILCESSKVNDQIFGKMCENVSAILSRRRDKRFCFAIEFCQQLVERLLLNHVSLQFVFDENDRRQVKREETATLEGKKTYVSVLRWWGNRPNQRTNKNGVSVTVVTVFFSSMSILSLGLGLGFFESPSSSESDSSETVLFSFTCFSDVILSFPWKHCVTADWSFFFFFFWGACELCCSNSWVTETPDIKSRCSVLRSHERKSRGSPATPTAKRFSERLDTSNSNSWGLIWLRKFPGFHIFLMRAPKRPTSSVIGLPEA